MKFGSKLVSSLYPDWQEHYLDYNGLKKELKAKSSGKEWDAQDEKRFIQELERNLQKCENFQLSKAKELAERIEQMEKRTTALVKSYDAALAQDHDGDSHHGLPHVEGRGAVSADYDAGSDDEMEHGDEGDEIDGDYDEHFKELEEDVATLVADVHDLALYTKLNFTGFMKIVKKHDKVTGFVLKPGFSTDYLEKHPFYKYNYDGLIVKLSKLFDNVRTRGHPVEGDASAGGSQNAFVRSTTKYWVHEDNIVHLKLAILKHLPVLVFNAAKDFEIKDSAITSIYFDNEDLELYLGRLEKTEGAEAIRLRWYGDMKTKTIFVERKTHREDWTGEKSVKARFAIPEHKVNDFLAGRITMDADFDELVKKGKKTAKEMESVKQLANEVQYAIVTRKLQPVMRSFYNRTAFQLPGDARVRISLDTELAMVREDDLDGVPRAGKNWRRMDIGIDHPFEQLAKLDREIFPYAVLEVKLQTQLGQEPPEWIRELIASHLVEAVPKFSKFCHGCAALLPTMVDLVPFWLPQMDQDIRKPANARSKVAIERPHSTAQSSASNGTSIPASPSSVPEYHEPVSEGEEDDEYLLHPAKDEESLLNLPADQKHHASAAKASREKEISDAAAAAGREGREAQGGKLHRTSTDYGPRVDINPLHSSRDFDKKLKLLAGEGEGDEDAGEYGDEEEEVTTFTREFRAPEGKRIAMPVRVEPKVYFANERTFLKWLHFAVLLATISTALLNFIQPNDTVGLISATCYTVTALLAVLYSGGRYAYRTINLTRKNAIEWHDPYGPTVLCLALVTSIMVNLVLRLRQL